MTRFTLAGLPGENPLGFMAAVGTLLVAERAWPEADARLAWSHEPEGWRPVLVLEGDLSRAALLEGLLAEACRWKKVPDAVADARRKVALTALKEAQARFKAAKKDAKAALDAVTPRLKGAAREAFQAKFLEAVDRELRAAEEVAAQVSGAGGDPTTGLGANLKLRPDQVEPSFRRAAIEARPAQRRTVDLFAGFGCEARPDQDGNFSMSRWSKQNGNSGKNMLQDVEQAMRALTVEKLERSLFAPWDYGDEKWSLGWDPADVRPFAHQANDPADGAMTMHGANVLAYEAMAVLPVVLSRGQAVTLGVTRQDRQWCSTWALWSMPLRSSVIRSVLANPALHRAQVEWGALEGQGVVAAYRAEHFSFNKSARFRPARPL